MQALIFLINALYPLLIIPVITSSLKIDAYGVHALAFSIMNILSTALDFGSTLKITSIIAKVSRTQFGEKLILFRSVLALILFMAMAVLNIVIESSILNYLFLSFGWFFGLYLFPIWITNGKEFMHIQVISLIISRCFILIFIFIFHEKNILTLEILALLSSFGGMIYLITGFIFLFKELNFNKLIRFEIKPLFSIDIYFSSILSGFQRNAPILLGSLFLPTSSIGIFAISDRLIKSFQSSQSIFGNALFPMAIKNYSKTQTTISKKWFLLISLYYSSIVAFCLFGGEFIISYLAQNELQNSDLELFRLFSIIIVFGGINYTLYNLILIPSGKEKLWRKSMVISTLLFPLNLLALTNIWDLKGLILATIIFEVTALTILIYYLYNAIRRSNSNL